VLQARNGRRWATLGSARTRANGRFVVRSRLSDSGEQQLRVRFTGDRSNAAVSRSAGRVNVFRQSTASWYEDAGNTACGFHARYGVANLSLPCGTHVTFSYGGRTVTATVDDRGPYVGGREWDLNQNTAAALGFAGVATVWSSP
jgi:rare lipoprotein A (peptidoglycan hydrolase)